LAKIDKAQVRENEYYLQARSVTVTINSKTYFSTCNTVLPMTSNSDNPLPEFVSQGKLRIVDKNGRAVKGLPKTIILDNSKLEHKFTLPIKKGVDKLYAQFSYRCAGFKISYTRELLINRHNDYVAHNANLRS
ncbi:MAG: hypothetical protein HRT88_04595, partial [Lentisphaeraceae bacterium]|nr:hypothetical protein [Lentisphaeraceae bacterium]